LACQFSMGEYKGRPNYLLQSARGLQWTNLPPDLEALVKMPNMVAKKFALGPRGIYWFIYLTEDGSYEQRASATLWTTLNQDWKHAWINRLSFGARNIFWGEKEWMENGRHLVQQFGDKSQTLIDESTKNYPGVASSAIDFVAIGVLGSWVMGASTGEPRWSGIDEMLETIIEREDRDGHRSSNIVCCPCRSDIYWIELSDDTIFFLLPTDWNILAISKHLPHDNKVDLSNCLMCRRRPKNGRFDFCGIVCRNQATNLAPLLLEISGSHTTFTNIEHRFRQSWNSSTGASCPQVRRVYRVVESSALLATYTAYRKKYGNEQFRYHGTKHRCQVGNDSGRHTLCGSSSCNACSIIKTSFKVSLAGRGGA